MDRLRRGDPSILELLEPVVAERLLGELFPSGDTHDPDRVWESHDIDTRDYVVSVEEVVIAIKSKRRDGCPAPGPDGISLLEEGAEMCFGGFGVPVFLLSVGR